MFLTYLLKLLASFIMNLKKLNKYYIIFKNGEYEAEHKQNNLF